MSSLRDAIREIYAEVRAPDWAAPNLDALADVLRDLSWLPPGPVVIELPPAAADRLVAVIEQVAAETSGGPRPIRLTTTPGDHQATTVD